MVLLALWALLPAGAGGQGLDSLFVAPPGAVSPASDLPVQGEIIGRGPVRVALLLPLSGSAAPVGRAIANGAWLGMDHALALGGQNVHLVLKDAGGSASSAGAAAQQAVNEGAVLILGPLTAEAVEAAGAAARAAQIPLVGFSSMAEVAMPGVYLLSVLPEAEISRVLGYAAMNGRISLAALIADTPLGRARARILEHVAYERGFRIVSLTLFSSEAQARDSVERLLPALGAGEIDTLYLPDRATAPSFGLLFGAARAPREPLMVLGSADWEGDADIAAQSWLEGAVYPAVDPGGLAAIAPAYRARFGADPHPFATIGFTAALLANAVAPDAARSGDALTAPAGFTGRDGPFRFHMDGRGEYGLVMRQLREGGAVTIEGARLGGLPHRLDSPQNAGNVIPPAAQFQ